jgi:plastocyanin
MSNGKEADLLFVFFILFTLSLSIISNPLSLTSSIYAESDGGDDGSKDDGGDDGSKDDGGDDGSKDDGGDDGSKDDGDSSNNQEESTYSEDNGGDDGDSSNNQEESTYSEDDGSKSDMDDGALNHQDSEGDTQSSETEGDTQSSETEGDTQTSQTDGETQTSQTEGTSFLASILSPLQLLPSQTDVDSQQNSQELSNVNSLSDNCDPADPACSESPCDPADPACSESPCDPEDPACDTESDCGDGVDNDGDDAIDGEDPDCGNSGPPVGNDVETDCGDGVDNDGDDAIDGEDPDCGDSGGPLPPNEREKFCSDGIDNDGNGKIDDLNECESLCFDGTDNDADGKIDTEDNDCQPGGPCPFCSPTGGGAGGNNENNNEGGGPTPVAGGDNENNNEGGGPTPVAGGDNENNNENNNRKDVSGGENNIPFLAQAGAQAAQGENGEKVFYVLIENANNETNFVPDKVTLTDGFTVVWINKDNSKDHSLTITDDSGKPLFNSPVQHNNLVKYKFESEGTYLYSDPDNPQSGGIITVLKSGVGSEDEISKPVQGMDLILSSLGLR